MEEFIDAGKKINSLSIFIFTNFNRTIFIQLTNKKYLICFR